MRKIRRNPVSRWVENCLQTQSWQKMVQSPMRKVHAWAALFDWRPEFLYSKIASSSSSSHFMSCRLLYTFMRGLNVTGWSQQQQKHFSEGKNVFDDDASCNSRRTFFLLLSFSPSNVSHCAVVVEIAPAAPNSDQQPDVYTTKKLNICMFRIARQREFF